jgi:hypothetical protein
MRRETARELSPPSINHWDNYSPVIETSTLASAPLVFHVTVPAEMADASITLPPVPMAVIASMILKGVVKVSASAAMSMSYVFTRREPIMMVLWRFTVTSAIDYLLTQ